MNMDEGNDDMRDFEYRIKILIGMILSELILLAIFNLWPGKVRNDNSQNFESQDQPLVLSDIPITSENSAPAAPPTPEVPVVVPNNKIIKAQIPNLDISGNNPLAKNPISNGAGGNGVAPIAKNPERPPSVVKIVEPAVPAAAQKANVKVEVVVKFLVGINGSPEKITIAQIKLFDKKTGKFKNVSTIDYGIIDVTLKAAAQWRFRPAEQNGKKVRAYSKQIFTFGI